MPVKEAKTEDIPLNIVTFLRYFCRNNIRYWYVSVGSLPTAIAISSPSLSLSLSFSFSYSFSVFIAVVDGIWAFQHDSKEKRPIIVEAQHKLRSFIGRPKDYALPSLISPSFCIQKGESSFVVLVLTLLHKPQIATAIVCLCVCESFIIFLKYPETITTCSSFQDILGLAAEILEFRGWRCINGICGRHRMDEYLQ